MKYNLKKVLKLIKQKKIIALALITILILAVITFYIIIHYDKSGGPLSELTTSDGVNSLVTRNSEQVSVNDNDAINLTKAPTNNPNNFNEDKSVDNNSITVNPEGVTNDDHLEFYDDFDAYNSSWDYFKGFVLSEVRIDGDLYYQLLNKAKDVKIIIDKSQENAVIYHNGKSMNYYMDFLITGTSTYAALESCDVTGDGEEELIISHCYGGTGVFDTTCDVINVSSMTKYEIESYLNELSSRIKVEPLEIYDKSNLICRVTDVNGKISYGTVPVFETSELSDFSYDASKYNYIGVDSKDKCLTVSNGICLDYECLYYLGFINSKLLFNPITNCFELSDDFNVSIDEVNYDDLDNLDINMNETIEPGEYITPEATNIEVNDFEDESSQVNENLCKDDEKVVYSFRTTEEQKIATLCVNNEKDYIVFRYGTKDKIEMDYPDILDNSWNNFAYCYYLRGGGPENEGMDLNFITFKSKEYSYILYEKYYASEDENLCGLVIINNDTGVENDILGSSDSVTGTLIDFRWDSKIIDGSFVDSLILE